jgi:hypothetical protein
MDHVEFDAIVEERYRQSKAVLQQKAEEYAHGGNRFHNLDVAARTDAVTPVQAAWGMWLKHFVSVRDMVKGNCGITEELIDSKIGDAINYLLLMEGLLRRELQRKTTIKGD